MLSELAALPLTVQALAAIKPIAALGAKCLLHDLDARLAAAVAAIITERVTEKRKQEGNQR